MMMTEQYAWLTVRKQTHRVLCFPCSVYFSPLLQHAVRGDHSSQIQWLGTGALIKLISTGVADCVSKLYAGEEQSATQRNV